MQPKAVVAVQLLLLSLCCIPLSNGIGYTMPSGPIFGLVNDTINITCNIDLARTNGLDSTSLNWYTNGDIVDQRHVHIVNASAVQLVIPRAPPSKQSYICKLKTSAGYTGISYNDVTVGYRPSKVKNFKCVSHNWQNMTCTFEKFENPVASNYTLMFRVDRRDQAVFKCILTPVFDRTYTCTLRTDSKDGIYRQTYPFYYFTLTSENPLGTFVQEFMVDHYSSVIPEKPIELNVTSVRPNAVTLTWRTPLELQSFPKSLTHTVSYITQYDKTWRELPPIITSTHKDPIRYELTGLPYAHVMYDVRVRSRVSSAPDTPQMWSRNETVLFRSGSRIPDAPPATDAGAFYVDDNDHVYVYWRELPKHDENGAQFQYVVRSAQHLQKPTCNNFMAKYVNVKLNAVADLQFDISSSNAVGASVNTSHVRVPKRSQRCPSPGEIRNILHNNNDADRHYVFSWGRPHNASAHPITSYTVFWCRARNESPNQCDSGFNFTRVSANTTSYTHAAMNESLNFAVSANSDSSSSGMAWARCTAIANNDINKVTDAKPTVGSDRATFEWNTACIDESLSHGYIITYCLVQGVRDNSNCSEQPLNITIDGAAIHNHTIPSLLPYRTYKVRIAAKSTEKIGPLSDPVYFTTLEASPTPPRELTVSQVDSTTATLKWEPPAKMNGVLNRYIIYYNDEKWDMPKVGNASDPMVHVLSGLTANTHYTFTVRACTGARLCSNSSNTVEATTDVGPPGAVQLLGDARPGVISWLKPLQTGGNLDYYQLEVQHDGGVRTSVFLNGTRCTIAMDMCHAGEQSYTFRVRAVNLMYGPHAALPAPADHGRRMREVDAEEYMATGILTTMGPSIVHGAQRVCDEEDPDLLPRIRRHDKHAKPFAGEWLVVKNQDCRTNNRAMFAVLMASLFIVLVAAYLSGTFMFRKLKRMKDIDVELPEGLEDIILDIGGIGTKCVGGAGGGGHNAGIGGGGVGAVIGSDCGRLTEPMASMEKKSLFVSRAEQEESLLPLASDRSLSHSSEMDDGQSSGSLSQCEDSDGGGHDGSSGRTLLMGASTMGDFDQFLSFPSNTSPMISKFSMTPNIVMPVFVAPTVPPIADLPAGMYEPLPNRAPQTITNANGYVTHEAATTTPTTNAEPIAQLQMPAVNVDAMKPVSAPQMSQPLQHQQPPPPPRHMNGYMPWNAITAAALSAAAASNNAAVAASPSLEDGMDKRASVTSVAGGADGTAVVAPGAAAAMADKTGISGYVTHKQLSDFGQLIQ